MNAAVAVLAELCQKIIKKVAVADGSKKKKKIPPKGHSRHFWRIVN
jgi:hypothetical protein